MDYPDLTKRIVKIEHDMYHPQDGLMSAMRRWDRRFEAIYWMSAVGVASLMLALLAIVIHVLA